jgi:hypothetical protein
MPNKGLRKKAKPLLNITKFKTKNHEHNFKFRKHSYCNHQRR